MSKIILGAKLFVKYRIGRVRRRFYGAHARAILAQTKNGLILIDVEDQEVGKCLLDDGEYSWAEIEAIRHHLPRDGNLLIVGAHVGALAVPLSPCCAKLIAIEANPVTFGLLEMNLLINGCTNAKAIRIAASDKEEELQFLASTANSGGTKRVPKIRDFIYEYDNPHTISVKALPLDEKLPDQEFDVVVMDIEGSEYFALRGMQRILSSCSALFVEYLPHHLKQVSSVSVADFLVPISNHFSWLKVSPDRAWVSRDQFLPILQRMYDRNEGASSMLFCKENR